MSYITKITLANALRDLLEKTTLDKITVKLLVNSCGLNRQTFYYHFHDIYDLVDWMYQEQTRKLVEENIGRGDFHGAFLRLLRNAEEQRTVVMNTCHSLSREVLERHIMQVLEDALAPEVARQAQGLRVSEEDLRFAGRFFIFALSGYLLDWVDRGMEESAEALYSRLSVFDVKDLRAILVRLQDRNWKLS